MRLREKKPLRGPLRILFVGFAFQDRDKAKELKQIFDTAPDWLRYSSNSWFLLTRRSSKVWASLLKTRIGPSDQIVITEVAPDEYVGYASQIVWEWLERAKQRVSASKNA